MKDKVSQFFPRTRSVQPGMATGMSGWTVGQDGTSETQFLRTWFEFDSQLHRNKQSGRVNWGAIMGLLLVLGISGGAWTGVGYLIAHFAR